MLRRCVFRLAVVAEMVDRAAALLELDAKKVHFVVSAIQDGATVPFLARYRRDRLGDKFDETVIKTVQDTYEELQDVAARRLSILKSLKERRLLTEHLQAELMKATTLAQLEDTYDPYREKRVTLANQARAAGLGPLQDALLNSSEPVDIADTIKRSSVSGQEAHKLLVALLAELMNRDATSREAVFHEVFLRGQVTVELEKTEKGQERHQGSEQDYQEAVAQFSKEVGKTYYPVRMSAHQVLVLKRGEAKGVLKLHLEMPDAARKIYESKLKEAFPAAFERQAGSKQFKAIQEGIQHAFDHCKRSVSKQVWRKLKEDADTTAIAVFAHNLRRLLLSRPLRGSLVAMDPGYRMGIKCVILDENGDPKRNFVVKLHEPEKMRQTIAHCIRKLDIRRFAIGDGTASHETNEVVASVIKETDPDGELGVEFATVSESGASVYSASEVAAEEFPNMDIMYRGAVSIGRRLQDPLSELIKIPTRSIGVGMYQHDVAPKKLDKELTHVTQSVVSRVGVNMRTASEFLLRSVPGLSQNLAKEIVKARRQGQLVQRSDLQRVRGIDATKYEQVAGFLRFPSSPNWLDNTSIHPESYGVVDKALKLVGVEPPTEKDEETGQFNSREFAGAVRSAMESIEGGKEGLVTRMGDENAGTVLEDLARPQLDPRTHLKYAGVLRTAIVKMEELSVGDRLKGIVKNVTPFGSFVDVGAGESVLLTNRMSRNGASQQQQQQPSSPATATQWVDMFGKVNVGDILDNLRVVEIEQRGRRWLVRVEMDESVERSSAGEDNDSIVTIDKFVNPVADKRKAEFPEMSRLSKPPVSGPRPAEAPVETMKKTTQPEAIPKSKSSEEVETITAVDEASVDEEVVDSTDAGSKKVKKSAKTTKAAKKKAEPTKAEKAASKSADDKKKPAAKKKATTAKKTKAAAKPKSETKAKAKKKLSK